MTTVDRQYDYDSRNRWGEVKKVVYDHWNSDIVDHVIVYPTKELKIFEKALDTGSYDRVDQVLIDFPDVDFFDVPPHMTHPVISALRFSRSPKLFERLLNYRPWYYDDTLLHKCLGTPLIKVLIYNRKQLNPNVKDHLGNTVTFHCAGQGDLETILDLLVNDHTLEIEKEPAGIFLGGNCTAIEIARHFGEDIIAQLLELHIADRAAAKIKAEKILLDLQESPQN